MALKNTNKRRSKFWFKNEKEVLKKLGLEPIPGSGSGVRKEDGENEFILCQLKSTAAESISVKKIDVEKLYFHADQLRKIPIFVIQFLDGPMLIATPPNELKNIANYLNDELFEKAGVEHLEVIEQPKPKKIIKSRTKPTKINTSINDCNKIKTAYDIRKEREEKKKREERRRLGLE